MDLAHRDITEAPGQGTVGSLVRSLASSMPQATAVIDQAGQLSFADLDRQADEIAAALLAHGVARGDVAALLAPNQREWLEIMVAAARIGVVVAPISTWYRDDEIRYALAHSRAKILFAVDQVRRQDIHRALGRVCPAVDEPHLGVLRDPGFPALECVVALGDRRHRGAIYWSDFLAAGSNGRPTLVQAEAMVVPDDPLYLLYTSGSTARPKGVLLLQGHAVANGWEIGRRQGVVREDRTWMVQPLFWALASVNMLFSSWGHGSAVVLEHLFDAGEALDLMEQHRVTRAYAIGNITSSLVDHPAFATTDLSALTKGVALFSPADRRAALSRLGMTSFVSLYGSTETHGVCFSARYDDPVDSRLADNGTLLDGWEYRLVRPGTSDPVPGNVGTGEVTVRGRLSPGYFQDPEATANAFDGDGWFHTGDLVEIAASGRLEFTARLTEVIKTGGINVSPAEVENLLSQLPGLRQAHVVGVPHPVKGEIVVAIVEAGPGLDEADVREWIAERAASYKVPQHVIFASDNDIPRLATGKVAKQQLKKMVARKLT